MERSPQPASRRSVLYGVLGTLAGLAGLFWYIFPSKPELSDNTYEFAIALYRVCNQQDDRGLQRIQGKLDELTDLDAEDDAAIAHLQRIVEEARAGNWRTAMRNTRNVLEDQAAGP